MSKLLSLLLDQRPSPKLVLIILQLCRAALPLMSVEDCGNVELPPWSYSVPSLNSEQDDPSDPASKIASLLLAKLADYVVPGSERPSFLSVNREDSESNSFLNLWEASAKYSFQPVFLDLCSRSMCGLPEFPCQHIGAGVLAELLKDCVLSSVLDESAP